MLAVLAVALGLTAAQPIDVAGTPISRAQLEHLQRIVAKSEGRTGQWRRERFRHDATRLLTSQLWLAKEARAQGVLARRAEVDRRLRQETRRTFGSDAAFRRFLRRSGQSRADIRLRIRADMHATRLRDRAAGDATGDERQTRVEAFAREFKTRWQERTTCSPRYHVEASCRQITRRGPGR